MSQDTIPEAINQLVSSITKDTFNEDTTVIDEETRIGYIRAEFELLANQMTDSGQWKITINNKVRVEENGLGIYPTKEKAKEVLKLLLTAYNYGFLEGIEKGQKFGTEDYPDGMSFAIGFQEYKE